MKTINKQKLPLAAAFTLSLVAAAVNAQSQNLVQSTVDQKQAQRFIVQMTDRSIISLQQGKSSPAVFTQAKVDLMQQTAAGVSAEVVLPLPQINAMAVMLDSEQYQALSADPNVALVEVDPKRYLMAESSPYGIGMVQANLVSDSQTANRKVCITDTGYTRGHSDLPSTGVTGDDGYGSNNTGNWYSDGNGHGTHVAGTIAAIGGNNQGVVGVNPSGLVGLHIVKVFDDSGSWAYGSDMVAAVNQCVAAGADVISMSLGGGAASSAERQAFANATSQGVLSIAAAGNDGNSTLSYPASYDEVMSVAAVDSSGTKASFSQYNSQVEIAAPGVDVNSTWNNGGYKSISGTSMATPHVAGVAALVWSHFPSCTPAEIRSALNATAEDRGSAGRDTSYGYGIVKAKAAYDYLLTSSCGGGGGVDQPPVANFNVAVNGSTVNFSNASSDDNGISSYYWDFGDQTSSTQASPVHTYTSNGDFSVTLTVTDTANQTSSKSATVSIGSGGGEGCDGLSAWNASTSYAIGDLVSYSSSKYEATWWSTGAQPDVYSNVWADRGECSGGSNPNQPPVASFSASASGLTVSFSSQSTDDNAVSSHAWQFGDGSVSNQTNPVHTFGASGDYQVSLTVEDAQGLSHTQVQTVAVADGVQGCNGLASWSASTVYNTGDQVAYNNVKYTANWWTQNQNPADNSGQWAVWSNNGSCN
ncbi:S8 family serine peptidase [Shewanella woodyi]|uniref:Peptidase S8 and S53 subtilisin kexin sedolisin n=1 Tax=Shewanella woodyi (strain ATCC 51908 / MS32) TaxID=392500 RepID=B1KM18_SHEWM|nr:S8 family serine peptidase [Shewanella woodyi]ACA88898.1 peptidase S8 and S53 subtilisin kexin sedolisin [Shewanella woodyi ATCC 51908]